MIINMIYKMSQSQIINIENEMKNDSSLFLVELDGAKIQTLKDYITEIETKFEFPSSCELMEARYLDWIRDLTWFEEGIYEENKIEKFALVINNYSEFCKKNPSLRNEIIDDYKEYILPFWEDEVERVVVEGKAKSFNVYLVD